MSATPQIVYLALTTNNETQWNVPLYNIQAVQQAILTRLRLFQGEWWANLTDGLPLWQSILAQGASPAAQAQMETLIGARIFNTPFVTGLQNVGIVYTPSTRTFLYSAQVNTQFGAINLSNYPVPPVAQVALNG
jgi:hypothetical protein